MKPNARAIGVLTQKTGFPDAFRPLPEANLQWNLFYELAQTSISKRTKPFEEEQSHMLPRKEKKQDQCFFTLQL